MGTVTINPQKYQALLGKALPVVIHTDAEYRRLLDAAAQLMEKSDEEIGEEEGRLLEMLSMLIEEYESRRFPLPETAPHEMLKYLLDVLQLHPRDLWDILPKSRVSEILAGKRSISKSQAKALAARFRTPVEIFL